MSEYAPAVLVPGNPEADAARTPLPAELGRDGVVCLSPPGFRAPIPPGSGAPVGECRDWLVDRLEAFDGPVDLVGHDWGGGHAVDVADPGRGGADLAVMSGMRGGTQASHQSRFVASFLTRCEDGYGAKCSP